MLATPQPKLSASTKKSSALVLSSFWAATALISGSTVHAQDAGPGAYASPADVIRYYGNGERHGSSVGPGYVEAYEGMVARETAANKSRVEVSNIQLYASIKRADAVVNQELASERAKQAILASQFQANLRRAMAGDAEAQYLVGKAYRDGLGVEKNEPTAFDWFGKSASHGNMHGENTVGYDYLYGSDGVAKDYALALQWLRKAAAHGNPRAYANLGDMYYYGWGVAQDYASALTWYRKASLSGNAYAENMMGYMYDSGTGTKKDVMQATALFRNAAAKGNDVAQRNLGIHYQNGEGVPADRAMAAFWYRRASRQGNDDAQKSLHDLLNGGTDIGIKVPDNPPVPPTPMEIAAKAKADADAAKAEAVRREEEKIAAAKAAEEAERARIAKEKADEDAIQAKLNAAIEEARIYKEKHVVAAAAVTNYLGMGPVPPCNKPYEVTFALEGTQGHSAIEVYTTRPTIIINAFGPWRPTFDTKGLKKNEDYFLLGPNDGPFYIDVDLPQTLQGNKTDKKAVLVFSDNGIHAGSRNYSLWGWIAIDSIRFCK